ncbi:MAG: carbohydrate ABC transporter permease [Christensenellales bacterium]|jgi:putative aldouronate transport system permease protein
MNLKVSKNTIHYSIVDRVFIAMDGLILTVVLLVILYPLLFVLSSSFSGGSEISRLSLIPERFSLEGYKAAVEYDYFWGSYWNSFVYTIIGTVIAMVTTILCAYPLSQPHFKFGKIAIALCVFTMYFSGGLIPTYLWIRNMGLMNSPWAFLLPSALNIYNMIIMRTHFGTLPKDIQEAAQIDGCGEWRYLVQIALPLSGAVLAVVALYYGVARWNAYFDSMIYLQERSKLPLQNILREVMIVNTSNLAYSNVEAQAAAEKRAELLKYSMIVIASIPMLLFYPFVQKYFVKGVMIGAVKG